MTATSVECYECGNALSVYNGTFIDWECQKAYTKDEFEAAEEQWALYQARATAEHLAESRWEEGWH